MKKINDGLTNNQRHRRRHGSACPSNQHRDTRVKGAASGYPGGKAGLGIYHRIINQIPPHDIYIEPFLGGGVIMHYKRSALLDVGVDIRGDTIADARKYMSGAQLYHGDGMEYLKWLTGDRRRLRFCRRRPFPDPVVAAGVRDPRIVIYCDPPYLRSTRRSSSRIYEYEVAEQAHDGKDETWHLNLLNLLNALPFNVMLSGYMSKLYSANLRKPKWRDISYRYQTRGGQLATEHLWCNFPQPRELHDYCYLGENRRQRERIKRKKTRWRNKLKNMPDLERYAILGALQEVGLHA